MRLSCIIPVYNEKDTILEVVNKVLSVGVVYEVVIVDDASTDGTVNVLREKINDRRVKVLFHIKNSGKGSAVRTGISGAIGDTVVIQDADMEYNPEEFRELIKPLKNGEADVVYGSRLSKGKRYRSHIHFWLHAGNAFITWVANLLYGARLTDLETCYKMFKKSLLDGVTLRSNGFDIEPELTAKFLKKKARIVEIPISYQGRSYSEGKKIFWWHGFEAIWTLIKYRFMD